MIQSCSLRRTSLKTVLREGRRQSLLATVPATSWDPLDKSLHDIFVSSVLDMPRPLLVSSPLPDRAAVD